MNEPLHKLPREPGIVPIILRIFPQRRWHWCMRREHHSHPFVIRITQECRSRERCRWFVHMQYLRPDPQFLQHRRRPFTQQQLLQESIPRPIGIYLIRNIFFDILQIQNSGPAGTLDNLPPCPNLDLAYHAVLPNRHEHRDLLGHSGLVIHHQLKILHLSHIILRVFHPRIFPVLILLRRASMTVLQRHEQHIRSRHLGCRVRRVYRQLAQPAREHCPRYRDLTGQIEY